MSDQATAPTPGSPEYDAAMIAVFENRSGTPVVVQSEEEKAAAAAAASKPQKPEGVPEKFWDAEKGEVRVAEMAKSYSELEKSKGKPAAAPAAGAQPTDAEKHAAQVKEHATKRATLEAAVATAKAKQGATPEEIKSAEDALKAHGEPPAAPAVDVAVTNKGFISDLAAHLNETQGQISEEMYARAEKLGYDKDTLDNFVAGQQALQRERDTEVKTKAGVSAEQWTQMREWAGANLSIEERQAINSALADKNAETAVLALKGLQSKYVAAVGSDPKLLGGNRGTGGTSLGYTSLEDQKKAQRDPRYKTDAKFREEVERKIAASTY
jgi:hypothetical protein